MLSQRYKDSRFCRYEDTQIEHYCLMGSTAHWTLPYMTIFTLHMFSYNSVIDSFCSKSLTWRANVCSLKDTKIQGFEDMKIRRLNTTLFHGINCTLNTAVHDNFYSSWKPCHAKRMPHPGGSNGAHAKRPRPQVRSIFKTLKFIINHQNKKNLDRP
jgi:hypothetical protein